MQVNQDQIGFNICISNQDIQHLQIVIFTGFSFQLACAVVYYWMTWTLAEAEVRTKAKHSELLLSGFLGCPIVPNRTPLKESL